jgi:hypothetical protein
MINNPKMKSTSKHSIETVIKNNEEIVDKFFKDLPNPMEGLTMNLFRTYNLTPRNRTKYNNTTTRSRYTKIRNFEMDLYNSNY